MVALSVLLVIVSLLIFNIICGAISEKINREKGYDGGFAWGFLLCILGIVVTAVRPYRQYIKTRNNTVSEVPHIFWCTGCGSTFSSSNSKHTECPTCKCTLKETTILAEDWRRLSSDEKLQLKREFANGKHIKSSLYNDNNKEKTDSSSFSKADEIRKFKDLLDEGAITEEEYKKAKTKLLS
ncbi:MAG: SHOCT domain-containing protein [Spirochaetales bacterium]|nr:SHOCT domain-containing protein [Spirochaetales bacterium]